MKLQFEPSGRVGPFLLDSPIDSLREKITLVEVPPTEAEVSDGIQSYSALIDGVEVALVDVSAGLISAVTTFRSFLIDGQEMIGKELSTLEAAVGESFHDVTSVKHDDGSVVDYFDFPNNRLVVTTENVLITSVCVFSES